MAKETGDSVIRIFQVDVYNDKNDWENKLTEFIKKYEAPKFLYISSGDHYVNFVTNITL